MQWSYLQRAVFAHVSEFPCAPNLVVEAVAGSGKTTTVMNALRHCPRGARVLMLAFNKSIADELRRRAPRGVECRTFHSLGMSAFSGMRPKVEGRKNFKILRELGISRQAQRAYGAMACRLVSLSKQIGVGLPAGPSVHDESVWWGLVGHHGLMLPNRGDSMDEAIALAQRVLVAGNREAEIIDFDDMLYRPLLRSLSFPSYDIVFVDESQDTNPLQIDLLRQVAHDVTRFVFVGDRRQAIYGFRGADAAAMDAIETDFQCVRLPLSVTYRCARAVVEQAQQIAPEIQPREGAPDGTVVDEPRGSVYWDEFLPSDAVLCRNTAPLLEMAYAGIAAGHGCKVLGRDIGKGLITLADKMAGTSSDVDVMLDRLRTYTDAEIAKAVAKDQPAIAARLEDQESALRVAVDALPRDAYHMAGLRRSIEALFTEDDAGDLLTLCTIHRSKGHEWDRVFILEPDLMPSKWARKPWQRIQEENLEYVAITRARDHLEFLLLSALKTRAAA